MGQKKYLMTGYVAPINVHRILVVKIKGAVLLLCVKLKVRQCLKKGCTVRYKIILVDLLDETTR